MSEQHIRSHAAHRARSSQATIADVPEEELPSSQLHSESEYVHALLEQLDDVIFAAVRGDASALKQAHTLWPQVVDVLGWKLVEESREQYLRFAIEVARRDDFDHARHPEHAIAALDIISLLAK